MSFWRYLALGWRVDWRAWAVTWVLCLIAAWAVALITVAVILISVGVWEASKVFSPSNWYSSTVPKAVLSVHTKGMKNEDSVLEAAQNAVENERQTPGCVTHEQAVKNAIKNAACYADMYRVDIQALRAQLEAF